MLSTQSDNCKPICPCFDIISLFPAEVEEPKIGISGKGLSAINHTCTQRYLTKSCLCSTIYQTIPCFKDHKQHILKTMLEK